jgi:iron complex outermembrane receptor protein
MSNSAPKDIGEEWGMGKQTETITRGFRAGIASLAFIATSPVWAQEAPTGAAGDGLDEIVVTARKVAENLQDVPISITALSGEELAQRNATTVYDVQRGTPSLFIRTTSSSSSTLSIALRGQFQGSSSLNTDPSVATYVDGLFMARTFGLNGDLLDISNVQVLKGPQGTLFGRNTTGGAIVIETNAPSLTDLTATITGRYGSYDERSGSAVVNLPLSEGMIGLRLAAQVNARDGWAEDIVRGDRYKDFRNSTIRAKLRVAPQDGLDMQLSIEHYSSKGRATANQLAYLAPNGLTTPAPTADVLAAGSAAAAALRAAGLPVPAGIDPFTYPAVLSVGALRVPNSAGGTNISAANALIALLAADPNAVSVDLLPSNKTWTTSAGFTTTADAGFAEIKLITGYRKVRDIGISDADGSPYTILSFSGSGLKQHQVSGELQATGKAFDDRLDFATGLYGFNEKGSSSSTTAGDYSVDNSNYGVYGQGTFHLDDRFSISAGGRYSTDIKRSTLLAITSVQTARRDKFSGTSFLLGAEYKPSDDVLLYAKVARSFRSGGQNSLPTQPAFKPEQATSYEIGEKGQFFDDRLRVNLSGYYSLTKDIQRTSFSALPDGTTVALIRNAGKLEIWGIEAEVLFKLPFGLELGATGGITQPKYLDYTELPNRTNLTGDRSSERIDSVPTRQFALTAAYRGQVGPAELLVRGDYAWNNAFALMPNVAFVGDPLGVAVDPNTGKTIMQSIIDATTSRATGVLNGRVSLTFDDGRYEVALWGRNLTDKRDPVSALAVATLNFASIQRRDPRMWGIELRARFGDQ